MGAQIVSLACKQHHTPRHEQEKRSDFREGNAYSLVRLKVSVHGFSLRHFETCMEIHAAECHAKRCPECMTEQGLQPEGDAVESGRT